MPNQFRIKSKIPPVPPRVETNSSPQSLHEWKPTQAPSPSMRGNQLKPPVPP